MKATLTTLTPVHIGNGITYNRNMDFVQEDGTIYIIDDAKLLELIGVDHVHQWTSAIMEGGDAVITLLRNRGFKTTQVSNISKRICNGKDLSNTVTQLKEQYRASIFGPTIPGSSIKGAMRTMIWNTLIDGELDSVMPNDLKNDRQFKTSDAKLESKLFGKDATEKTTRFLKVGDVHFGEIQTEVYELAVLNKGKDEWKFKPGSILCEVIPAKSKSHFQLSLDNDLLKLNKEKNENIWKRTNSDFLSNTINLCKLVSNSTKDLIEWELEDLKNENLGDGEDMYLQYKEMCSIKLANNEMLLRVGAHNGWKFTTGGWFTQVGSQFPSFEFKNIRKEIQKNKDYPSDMMWPKTRKISKGGQIFGFVKIMFE